jgi:hypothetical protein
VLLCSATEEDLIKWMQEVQVTPVRIHRKQMSGEAYVEFRNGTEAKQAAGRNKSQLVSLQRDEFRDWTTSDELICCRRTG